MSTEESHIGITPRPSSVGSFVFTDNFQEIYQSMSCSSQNEIPETDKTHRLDASFQTECNTPRALPNPLGRTIATSSNSITQRGSTLRMILDDVVDGSILRPARQAVARQAVNELCDRLTIDLPPDSHPTNLTEMRSQCLEWCETGLRNRLSYDTLTHGSIAFDSGTRWVYDQLTNQIQLSAPITVTDTLGVPKQLVLSFAFQGRGSIADGGGIGNL